jgi:hypothetical protein
MSHSMYKFNPDTIPAATQEKAGLFGTADKTKLDGLSETGGGITVLTTDTSYEELLTLISTNALLPGMFYKITDFKTVRVVAGANWEFDPIGDKIPGSLPVTVGPVEPILVRALSESQLSSEAYSESFPEDILHYEVGIPVEFSFDRLGLPNDALGVDIPLFGTITYREDTKAKIQTHYDWRTVQNRRFNTVTELVDGDGNPILVPTPTSGAPFPAYHYTNGDTVLVQTAAPYTYVTDTGGNPILTCKNLVDFTDGIPAGFTLSGDLVYGLDSSKYMSSPYSAVTNTGLMDDQSSGMSYTGYFNKVSFWYSVSSEAGFDFFSVWVDGVEQQAWSGEVPWTLHNLVGLTDAVHTIEWKFIKDGAALEGTNQAWIDDITFESKPGPIDITAPSNYRSTNGLVWTGSAWTHSGTAYFDLNATGFMLGKIDTNAFKIDYTNSNGLPIRLFFMNGIDANGNTVDSSLPFNTVFVNPGEVISFNPLRIVYFGFDCPNGGDLTITGISFYSDLSPATPCLSPAVGVPKIDYSVGNKIWIPSVPPVYTDFQLDGAYPITIIDPVKVLTPASGFTWTLLNGTPDWDGSAYNSTEINLKSCVMLQQPVAGNLLENCRYLYITVNHTATVPVQLTISDANYSLQIVENLQSGTSVKLETSILGVTEQLNLTVENMQSESTTPFSIENIRVSRQDLALPAAPADPVFFQDYLTFTFTDVNTCRNITVEPILAPTSNYYLPALNNLVVGPECSEITIGKDCEKIHFVGNCSSISIGIGCDSNFFATGCSGIALDGDNSKNYFGEASNIVSLKLGARRSKLLGFSRNIELGIDSIETTIGLESTNVVVGPSCGTNTIGSECSEIVLGSECIENIIGSGCGRINLGDYCQLNTIKYNSFQIELGANCGYNTISEGCERVSFGKNSFRNSLGIGNRDIIFGDTNTDNHTSQQCFSITQANVCERQTYGGSCENISLGDLAAYNTFETRCTYLDLGDKAEGNSFHEGVKRVILGYNCRDNTFSDTIYEITLNSTCEGNYFGNDSYNITLSDYCSWNYFGQDCRYITLADCCEYFRFSEGCRRISIGAHSEGVDNGDPDFDIGCYVISLGPNCHYNTFGQDCNWIELGAGCEDNTFSIGSTDIAIGQDCSVNYFGLNCSSITLDRGCGDNAFNGDSVNAIASNAANSIYLGSNCSNNLFMADSYGISFGSRCNGNAVHFECYNITFGPNCENNIVSNHCWDINLGSACNKNLFGEGSDLFGLNADCHTITLGNNSGSFLGPQMDQYGNPVLDPYGQPLIVESDGNHFGLACHDIVLGDECNQNIFGENVNYVTFGNRCGFYTRSVEDPYANMVEETTTGNTLGSNLNLIVFGNDCSENILGDNFKRITLGNYCYKNNFPKGEGGGYDIRFGTYCHSNTLPACYLITFGDRCSHNNLNGYSYKVTFGNGISSYFGYSLNFETKNLYLKTAGFNSQTLTNDYYLPCGNGRYVVKGLANMELENINLYLGSPEMCNGAEILIKSMEPAGHTATIPRSYLDDGVTRNVLLDISEDVVVQPGQCVSLFCDGLSWRVANTGGGGGAATDIQTVTGNTTALNSNTRYLVDASAGPVTITLPEASGSNKTEITVKKIDATANTVTVLAETVKPDFIDGSPSIVLTTQNQSIMAVCNGINFYLV